jgi:hypothetical protein
VTGNGEEKDFTQRGTETQRSQRRAQKSVREESAEQLAGQFFSRQVEIVGDVAENLSECADPELFVIWDSDVVLCAFHSGTDADVAAGLTGSFVTEATQGSNKIITADIAGKLQAGMTSSLTV